MSEQNASALDAAVAAVLNDIAPLLTDRDVSGVLIDAGAIVVTRRGALERITARVSEAAWAELARTAPEGTRGLAHEGARVHIVKHQRVMMRVALASRASTLAALVESGALSEDHAAQLRLSLLDGDSHVVCGASRAARSVIADAAGLFVARRFVTFCAPSAADIIAAGAFSWPETDDGRCDADAVQALGASFVRVDDAGPDDVAAWHDRGIRVVATSSFVRHPGADEQARPFGAAHVFSVGARLHGGPVLNVPRPAVVAPPASAVPAPRPPAPAALLPAATAGPSAPPEATELPPLAPLPSGPPAGWASDDDTAAPGWELSTPPGLAPADPNDDQVRFGAAGDAFAKVLGEVKERPAFTPQKPSVHPQAAALQNQASAEEDGPDPFGGLTFEPPPGGEGEGPS